MKKVVTFISGLLLLAAAAFADVTVKKNADGKIEVTFFYGNPRATEVLVAGDFTNWQDGAIAMEKGEKGFSYTHICAPGTVMRYKFISDGNWTEDLREPDKVDDGFGGHNGLVDVDALLPSEGGDTASKKPSIKFMSWTMLGTQTGFSTQGAVDRTKKGLDFQDQTVGAKSYNKLTGNVLPNVPFFVEIALAERDIEDYSAEGKVTYIAKKDAYNEWAKEPEDGLKELVSDLASNPVDYLAAATDNSDDAKGPGTNPFLGHLKFGFDTDYVKYMTGFNYAKPDVRQEITWTTIDGHWDAGYEHVGGFAQFSTGNKINEMFADNGVLLDAGFAPNKTADRKGRKYGYWGWINAKYNDLVVDFQSNGAYDGEYMFDDAVEHDFILGAKSKVGTLSFAAQALLSTHQKSTEDLEADGASSMLDWSGYSTDIWYRDTDLSLQNVAANVKVNYEDEDKVFGAGVEYRMRGAQASMLYVRQNHDDGTFDLSEQLGVANSQAVTLNGYVNLLDDNALNLALEATAEMPLQNPEDIEDTVAGWNSEAGKNKWYGERFAGKYEPLFEQKGGAELTFTPAVTYNFNEDMSVNAYGVMNYDAYDYIDEDAENKYAASDSAFRFKKAGLAFSWKNMGDVAKGLDVYYGIDNSNAVRMWNTLVAQVQLPASMKVSAGVGIRTIKDTDAAKASEYDEDSSLNNPIGFAIGWSKQFVKCAKPVLYTQFVYNMDPYKHFGDGQDQLNLDRANVKGSHEKEGTGVIDAVDWYDGRGAFRVGIRWDI